MRLGDWSAELRLIAISSVIAVAAGCGDDGAGEADDATGTSTASGSPTSGTPSSSATDSGSTGASVGPGGPGAGGSGGAGGGGQGGEGGDGPPPITECNDGIDNDGDGLVDWEMDVGCWGPGDLTEASGSRDEESGWTTFDLSPDSQIVYVSADGDDDSDGATPETAVATPARGAELVRDGMPDFLLFRRGDTWRAQDIGDTRVIRRFKSGRDADHRLVVGSYGDSTERPRLEIDKDFVDDDGNERSYLAFVGLALVSYPKDPDDPDFNGADGGAFRFVGTGRDVLFEDNYLEYGEFVIQNVTDFEVRRNVVYRSYHVGTCAFNDDGTPNPNGDPTYRPSGIFAGGVDGLAIEGNVFDENGWNPDVEGACATIYNHDMYLSANQRLTVRDNLVLRASSIGIKLSSGGPAESRDILIENNLFAEGEIGISMGGNADTAYRFTDAVIRDNVFTDIGRAMPTTRTLSWYIELLDNDRTEVVGNLLVNQPTATTNAFGLRVTGGTERDISVHDNVFYDLLRRAVWVDPEAGWSGLRIEDNELVTSSTLDCLVTHDGGFASTVYAGNAYRSAAPDDAWFCGGGGPGSLDAWADLSGEDDATESTLEAPDPGRNLDTYAEELGVGTTLADFAAEARTSSRHRFRPELLAPAANAYIREGFGVPSP